MAVRSQDHLTAACEHLPRILVNDRLMRRYIHTAVFLRTGKAKHVVILIDGSAHRTQRIVAVRQHIRNREPLKP